MRVRILTKDNSWGLSTDVAVLSEALHRAGIHDITTADWQAPLREVADVQFFLELVNPAQLASGRKNILVPNPEWFMLWWLQHLDRFDAVWCKTKDALSIFGPKHKGAVFTGWTSPDRMLPGSPPVPGWEMAMLHVAGGSSAKGTTQVLKAMERISTSRLVVVGSSPVIRDAPPNCLLLGRVPEERLTELMNAYRVHLCPSSYEGFGHYINEALSVGALVITTNAAPMNELVTADFGIGCAVTSMSVQNLATHQHVDVSSLVSAIGLVPGAMAVHDIVSERARDAYVKGRAAFHANVKDLLKP